MLKFLEKIQLKNYANHNYLENGIYLKIINLGKLNSFR